MKPLTVQQRLEKLEAFARHQRKRAWLDPSPKTFTTVAVNYLTLCDGAIVGDQEGLTVYSKWMKSSNFSAGVDGWRITGGGSAEFNDVTVRGTVYATAGEIGGWAIGATAITGGDATLHSTGYLALGTGNDLVRADATDATYRLWVGHATAGSAPFRVSKAGALIATAATITGTITATAGEIGGWTINADNITGGNATLHSTGVLLLGTVNDIVRLDATDATYRLWVGHATAGSAPFRVSKAGAVTATSGTVGGWTLGVDALTGGNASLQSAGRLFLGTGTDIIIASATDASYRLWVGHTAPGSAPFRVTKAGALTATDATITGTITATAGAIGGWTINADNITGGNATLHSTGVLLLGTVNDIVRLDATDATYRLWVGHATAASAPFRVTKAGAVTATNANITGTIDANAGHIGTLDIDGVLTVGSAPCIQLDGLNKRIESTNFASGVSGFRINNGGDAEFNNVAVRGSLHCTVFVKDLLSAHAGTQIIAKSAGTLSDAMVVPASGTWYLYLADPPGGGFLFDNADRARAKDLTATGVKDTWFTVASQTDMGDGRQRYTCTFQSGDRPVTYPEGGAAIDYGVSGQGLLLMTAGLSSAPYYDVLTHAGSPWATQTLRLRLGNLAGVVDAELNPSGYGLYADNVFLKGKIIAATGEIGGWTIGASTLTGGDATLHSDGYLRLGTGNNIVELNASSGVAGYAYYRALTIDHTKVSGTLSNYSFLFNSIIADLKTVANSGHVQNTASGGASGSVTVPADLVFSPNTDGSSPYDFEVEKYGATTGELVAHIRIPSLSASVDTVLYICYGDSAVTTSQEDIAGTWDADFKSVWHFAESAAPSYDSASGRNLAWNSSPTQTAGKIGQAIELDGTDHLTGTTNYTLDNNVTWEFWEYNIDAVASPGDVYFSLAIYNAGGGRYAGLGIANATGTHQSLLLDNFVQLTTAENIALSAANAFDGTHNAWRHVAVRVDETNSKIEVFYDGVEAATYQKTITAGSVDLESGDNILLGKRAGVATYWHGKIEEFRISNVARSAHYITACYNNQSSPSTFYGTGAEQGAGGSSYRLWIGHATAGSAPFRVTEAGALAATAATITGAITATSGELQTLTVSGTLTLTGSGKLITAASPSARIEISTTELAGYSDATTKQFYIDATDGKAKAGGGVVVLGSSGAQIAASTAHADLRAYQFIDSSDNIFAGTYSFSKAAYNNLKLYLASIAGKDSHLEVYSWAPATYYGEVDFTAASGALGSETKARLVLRADSNASPAALGTFTLDELLLETCDLKVGKGLWVGSTTDGPDDNDVHIDGSINKSTALGCRVYNSALQAIPTATITTLAFNSENWDDDTIHSTVSNTGRLTCQHAGTYLITANVSWEADSSGYRMILFLVNGSTEIKRDRRCPLAAGSTVQPLTAFYKLAVDDYVQCRVQQDGANPLDVEYKAGYSPTFGMVRIA